MGLSRTLSFHDVYSLTDPDLLAFVPRPSLALLLVFPITPTYESHRQAEDSALPPYQPPNPAAEPIIWYPQTIGNACGMMGILHAVSNGKARDFVEPGSGLHELIEAAVPMAPTQRAELLYESEFLESSHERFASQGQSEAPGVGEDVDLHYVCFVKDEAGGLWEMDGRRRGPLQRATLGEEEDVLSETALEAGPRAFVRREEELGGGELRFSLLALGPSEED